jgi:hypothetical protein
MSDQRADSRSSSKAAKVTKQKDKPIELKNNLFSNYQGATKLTKDSKDLGSPRSRNTTNAIKQDPGKSMLANAAKQKSQRTLSSRSSNKLPAKPATSHQAD